MAISLQYIVVGRSGGLMVSVLDPGPSGLGSSSGWGTALCSSARHFTLTGPLHSGV